jgi:hypothetical protein
MAYIFEFGVQPSLVKFITKRSKFKATFWYYSYRVLKLGLKNNIPKVFIAYWTFYAKRVTFNLVPLLPI